MSEDTTQQSPETRVRNLETAARMQSHMNEALVICIDELYKKVRELSPDAESEPMQPLTGLELVRQMQQQMQNGTVKSNNTIEFIRKLNQERIDSEG
ncbi:MAG: hypothetical protein ACXWPS_09405 [Ktedonobacteraceae bacterium]